MKKILTLILMLSTLPLFAQMELDNWGLANTEMVYLPYSYSEYEVLDKTNLVVTYEAKYSYKDVRKGITEVTDLMELQIGEITVKFHSWNYDGLDRRKAFKDKKVKIRQNYLPYIITTDLASGKMTVGNKMPFTMATEEVVYEYVENVPKIKWALTEVTDSIAGYQCTKAECEFGGRSWTAWFTLDVSVPYGPWKLGGLPGLILKAEDSTGDYSFTVQEVLQQENEIIRPKWNYKKVRKNKWTAFEKDMYENPYSYFTQGGKFKIMKSPEEAMDASWTIKYNPIELK